MHAMLINCVILFNVNWRSGCWAMKFKMRDSNTYTYWWLLVVGNNTQTNIMHWETSVCDACTCIYGCSSCAIVQNTSLYIAEDSISSPRPEVSLSWLWCPFTCTKIIIKTIMCLHLYKIGLLSVKPTDIKEQSLNLVVTEAGLKYYV